VIPGKFESKAVQSNRSPVANISSFLKKKIKIEHFVDFLINVQLEKEGNRIYHINDADSEIIQKFAIEKFETWDWNWGYSPKYTFKNEVEIDGKRLAIQLNVKKGIIEICEISGTYFNAETTQQISAQLIGKQHFYEDVKDVVGINSEELIYTFF